MSTLTPTPKMTAAGITGAIALIIVWAAGMFGIPVPAEVAAAFAVVLAFAAGYLKRDNTSPETPAVKEPTSLLNKQLETIKEDDK